jgi:Spy/CpxP family protein refolding chaperone
LLTAAAAAALVFGLGFAGPAWAQSSGSSRPVRPRAGMEFGIDGGTMMTRVFSQLGLTPQQQQQVKGILQNREQELKSLGDQAFSARQRLHQAVVADNAARIATANSELSTAQLKMEELHAALRAQIFDKVLTPDQRTKANSMEAGFEQRMAEWHQKQDQRFAQWLAGEQPSSGGGQ